MARELGVATSTLRFWERQGLLGDKVTRGPQGYRAYTLEDREILRRVAVLREAGLELERIRRILHEGGDCAGVVLEIDAQRTGLLEAREEIEERLRVLDKARSTCLESCAPSLPACDCAVTVAPPTPFLS
jgi:DNA-binding transcriptional MerR regulator